MRHHRLRRIGQKQYWVDSTSPLPKNLDERIIKLDVYNTLWQKWDCQVTTDCEERANGAQRELMSAVLRPASAHTSFLFTVRCGNFHRIFSLCFCVNSSDSMLNGTIVWGAEGFSFIHDMLIVMPNHTLLAWELHRTSTHLGQFWIWRPSLPGSKWRQQKQYCLTH